MAGGQEGWRWLGGGVAGLVDGSMDGWLINVDGVQD